MVYFFLIAVFREIFYEGNSTTSRIVKPVLAQYSSIRRIMELAMYTLFTRFCPPMEILGGNLINLCLFGELLGNC